MKTIFKSALTLGLVVGLGFAANAQKATTAPASATILADLTITLDATQDEIAFGNISATTPGPIVLDANGPSGNSNTGSVTNVARFDLGGANSEVTVSYDATVQLTETMVGDAFMGMTSEVVGAANAAGQANAGIVVSGTTVTLVDNAYFLWVGGVISALDDQVTGIYAGTFNINVEYN